ncbi:metallophosphoesterase [Vibrio salinus]|uniref:metallophosphoesterase n=1 Tax=Vibrio salinus TaxID=2899784 RepID=UPI001E5566B8|nr:metallophosphoesterase [Vibrio salinus]MCE0494663.1 metallophosphoesterase [Vibrio salinus]
MKFIPVSDLHLDFFTIRRDFWQDFDNEAVLILAGDVSNSLAGINYIKNVLCPYFRAVVMVAGNHEWYSCKNLIAELDNYTFSKRYQTNVDYSMVMKNSPLVRLKEHANRIENFYFLDNESLVIDKKLIYGGTLWFPIHLLTQEDIFCYSFFMNDAKYLNYRVIEEQYKAFIYNAPPKADIIVSHHLPNLQAFAFQKDAQSDIAQFYHANLTDEFVNRTKFWLAGHHHQSVEKEIAEGVQFISNAKGYRPIAPGVLKNKVYNV